MTKQDYIQFHEQFCKKMRRLAEKKINDYNSSDEDAFANQRFSERIGVASVEQGLVVRMTDKISRVSNFLKNEELQVKDESVEDTLLDLANYSILLAGYLKSKKVE